MTSKTALVCAVVAGALALMPAFSATAATATRTKAMPQRIVSLNLCTDQILLDLVPRERIRALSFLATDALVSAVADKARGIPSTRGAAEEVLAFEPDLVIAGAHTTPATVALLERLGLNVLRVPMPNDIPGVRTVTRQIAAAVGAEAEADALLAAFDRRLTAVASRPSAGQPPTAVVYQVNNLASGPGTFADAVLGAAGLVNLAGDLGLGSGGQISLEALVARPPDLLVLSRPTDEYRAAVADNLRHPALAALMRARASVVVPWRFWLCATPYAADAVERLAAARDAIDAKRAAQ